MKKTLITTLILYATLATAQVPGAQWIVPPVIDSVESLEITPQNVDPRIVVKNKQNKFGLYDRSGKKLLPVIYNNLSLQEGWIVATLQDKPGSTPQKMLLNEQLEDMARVYDKFDAQSGGFAVVYKNNKCGLITKKGEEVVPVEYESVKKTPDAFIFVKGAEIKQVPLPAPSVHPKLKQIEAEKARKVLPGLVHVTKNGRSGFTNEKGDTIIPAIYTLGPVHPKGYLIASLDNKKTWGVINARHQTLYYFTATAHGVWSKSGLLPLRSEDKQWGLFKFPEGTAVIPFAKWDYIETYDAERDWFRVTKDKKVGVINVKGEVLLPVEYEYVSQADHITNQLIKGGKHGYWYRPARKKVEPKYTYITNLSDSLLIVGQGNEFALIEARTERTIIPFSRFGIVKRGPYFVTDFKYDSTVSSTDGGRLHGLYDRKGTQLFAPDSVDIQVLPDGSYYVSPHFRESMPNAEHRSAKGELLRSRDRLHDHFRNQYWFSSSKNAEGKFVYSTFSYLDPPGKEQRYASVKETKERVSMVQNDKKWGLTTPEGKVLIPPVFEAMEPSQGGYIKVKLDGKWGVLQNPLFDYFENL